MQPRRILAHRYEVIALVDERFEARSYRVRDLDRVGAQCQLTVARARATDGDLDAFRATFSALQTVAHPALIRVLDSGLLINSQSDSPASLPFYTTELVEGTRLEPGQLSDLQNAAKTAEALLLALDTLHRNDVLHRALSPRCIWQQQAKGGLTPRLDGYGLLEANNSADTVTYRAPEVLQGELASCQSDLYGLGATLFELVTGEPVVRGAITGDRIDDVLAGLPLQRVKQADQALGTLGPLLEGLLQLDPGARPRSALEALVHVPGRTKLPQELPQKPRRELPVRPKAPLRGRRRLLSELEPAAAKRSNPADATAGRFVWLTGAAGAGKTRVLDELRWWLQRAGLQVLHLRCSEAGAGATLDFFTERIHRLSTGSEPIPLDVSRFGLAHRRWVRFESLWQELQQEGSPVWLLVDDAQLADEDGDALLAYLSRAVTEGPVNVVVASRTEPRKPLAATAKCQTLSPYDPGDDDSPTAEPPADLSEPEQRVLRLLAVCPAATPCDLWPVEDREVLTHLERAGLIQRASAHWLPLERFAAERVLEAMSPKALTTLHTTWVTRWQSVPESAPLHTFHALELEPSPDLLAPVREAARRWADHGAVGRAARTLGWCVSAAAQLPFQQQVDLAQQYVLCLLAAGDATTAEEALKTLKGQPLSLSDLTLDEDLDGRQAVAPGGPEQTTRAPDELRRLLEDAVSVGDIQRQSVLHLELGTALLELGRAGHAVAHVQQATRLSRRLGTRTTLVEGLCRQVECLLEIGVLKPAERALEEVARYVAEGDLERWQALAQLYRAQLLWRQGKPQQSRAACREALGLLRAQHLPVGEAHAQLLAVEIATEEARLGAAREALGQARLSAGQQWPAIAGVFNLLAGRLLALEGAHPSAVGEHLDHARRWAVEHEDPLLSVAADLAGANLALGQQNLAEAGASVERTLETLRRLSDEIPEEYREPFWKDPRRQEALELQKRLQTCASPTPSARPAAEALSERQGAIMSSAILDDKLLQVLRINREMLEEHDLDRLLHRVVDTAIEISGAERGFLLVRGRGDQLRVRVARNIDHESLRHGKMKFSQSLARRVTESGRPLLTVAAQDDARLQHAPSVSELRLNSVMVVPIRSADAILGTLYLDNRFVRGQFEQRELLFLSAFADQVAVAMQTLRLTTELREQKAELERAQRELTVLNRRQAEDLATTREHLTAAHEALALARSPLKHEYAEVIGRGSAMQQVLALVDRVVDHNIPVLIGGESGTGKELIAQTIHAYGPRKNRPFVSINCAAIPEALLESELFGHKKGAFTGADRDQMGLFQGAHGGTLLLDEVGEMSKAMQSKMLRVLQEHEIRPVGSSEHIAVDVRILASTNRNLEEMVAQGHFRQDLYYRLNVISIDLPPLRKRREDIPLLAEFFVRRGVEAIGVKPRQLTQGALRRLVTYRWPGNIRQLDNVISNALVLADGPTILPSAITLPSRSPDPRVTRRTLADLERDAIENALDETGGNRSAAARILDISRATLQRKIRRWQAQDGD